MELAGVRTFTGLDPRGLAGWLFGSGLRIGLILLLSYAIVRVTSLIIARFEQDVMETAGLEYAEQAKRVRTLGNLLRSTLVGLVSCIALLMILRELHLDITPILTGAGIAGVAIGFGAQTLVKDVISGFFLLLENQVRVGDVVTINGQGGLVEALTLRTIVLRDETGAVHIFPNGSITTLANQTKDFSYYVINLAVDYDEDPDRVMQVMRDVADDLRADPKFSSVILQPLEINGIDSFTDSNIIIKSRIKTLPLKQWDTGRELRRRLMKRFAAEGIKFPQRQLVLHMAPAEEARLRALASRPHRNAARILVTPKIIVTVELGKNLQGCRYSIQGVRTHNMKRPVLWVLLLLAGAVSTTAGQTLPPLQFRRASRIRTIRRRWYLRAPSTWCR